MPFASVTAVSTTSPLRFSISACPMKLSLASLPTPLRCSLASGSRGRSVCRIAALLAAEVLLAVAARVGRVARSGLRPEALHLSPGLDLRAVHRKVLVGEEMAHLL